MEEDASKTERAAKVTTDTKQTKPKRPGRVAQGKKLAEQNKKKREAKKLIEQSNGGKEGNKSQQNEKSYLTVNQMIGIAGVCLSAYGLYLQREQLMGYFQKPQPQPQPEPQKEKMKSQIPIPVKNKIPQID